MKPVINLEEKIGKTVGRRTKIRDPFAYGMGLQKTALALTAALGGPKFPKGVFKFRTFEEADAWMMKYLTQKRPS